MQITLDIEITGTYYEPADDATGTPETFQVEEISFFFNGYEITSLAELHEMIITNKQQELVKMYLDECKEI